MKDEREELLLEFIEFLERDGDIFYAFDEPHNAVKEYLEQLDSDNQ